MDINACPTVKIFSFSSVLVFKCIRPCPSLRPGSSTPWTITYLFPVLNRASKTRSLYPAQTSAKAAFSSVLPTSLSQVSFTARWPRPLAPPCTLKPARPPQKLRFCAHPTEAWREGKGRAEESPRLPTAYQGYSIGSLQILSLLLHSYVTWRPALFWTSPYGRKVPVLIKPVWLRFL